MPYHTPGMANGLAFAVNEDCSMPPSLQNIYKEAYTDLGSRLWDQTLQVWANQGVLLLNTSLTVVEGQPLSHSSIGWDMLIGETLRILQERTQPTVFILWGSHAQKQVGAHSHQHLYLSSAHPSPLSASRGFFGSRPFSRSNEFLSKHGLDPIEWNRKPEMK